MSHQGYHQAVQYLESFIQGAPETPRTHEEREAQWAAKLPSMEFLLEQLGSPHKRFPTAHIGGTSGKGSTSTFVASILQAAGYRTGLHTSPYLQVAIEKIQVDGRYISPQEFAALVEGAAPLLNQAAAVTPYGPLNFVQLWTALALLHLAQRKVDMGVIEVSLGGRFDFTNVISPLVTAITTVDYDHTTTLGNTLAEIGWHKAGIIKADTPVVSGVRHQEALEPIFRECAQKNAPLYLLGREFTYSLRSTDKDGSIFDYRGMHHTYPEVQISMLGEHQVLNASIALGVVECLQERGYSISEKQLRDGLANAYIPGRMEVVQEEPLVVLDGAHNPEKAIMLRRSLERLFPNKSLILILSIGASKDAAEVLHILAPLARLVLCTAASVTGKPATLPDQLLEQVRTMGAEARAVDMPLDALDQALALADKDTLVCATGSLFLVGVLRERWHSSERILAAVATASPTTN